MMNFKKSCISVAILLALGVFSGNVWAEEVKSIDINSENKIDQIEYDVIEAREMVAGDEVSELEDKEVVDFLQASALFTPRLTGPEKGRVQSRAILIIMKIICITRVVMGCPIAPLMLMVEPMKF